MFEKTIYYWFAVLGAAIYVYSAQKDMPFPWRLLKVLSACLLGVSVSPEISEKFGSGENMTLVAVITLGWVVIDAATTLIKQHKPLMDMIRKLSGGDK